MRRVGHGAGRVVARCATHELAKIMMSRLERLEDGRDEHAVYVITQMGCPVPDGEDDVSAVRLVNAALLSAHQEGADALVIRRRADATELRLQRGDLSKDLEPTPAHGFEAIARRLLLMAECEPWRRPPQIGSFQLRLRGGRAQEVTVEQTSTEELIVRLRWSKG